MQGHVLVLTTNQICSFEGNMATDSNVVAFVRQQLAQFGIRGLSEEELEVYASELKQLLAAEGVEPSSLDTPTASLDTPTSSMDTPISTPHSQDAAELSPNVAVFKTFPLSANPSPLVLQPQGTPKPTPPVLCSARRRKVSRLNRSQSMEDSTLTDVSSLSCASGGGSLVDYRGNQRMTTGPSWEQPQAPLNGPPTHQLKSYIRPSTAPQAAYAKCDPVARYNRYRQCWARCPTPGEQAHTKLRWIVREWMCQVGGRAKEPVAKPASAKVNTYVVPTTKKRQELCWRVRQQMAQQ